MSEAIDQYKNALKARRAGVASELGAEATLLEIKGDYYADARMLSEDALLVFEDIKSEFPPYGLMGMSGEPLTDLQDSSRPWYDLTRALSATGQLVFDRAIPSIVQCPYHQVLTDTVGKTYPPLSPMDNDERGLDTFRNAVTPAAKLNAPFFTSIIRRMPALQELHGSHTDPELFARNSISLLREPLSHPQQWAAAFVYSLGALQELLTDEFLGNNIALTYTKLEKLPDGTERLAWAIPTEDFTTRFEIRVADRTRGSEIQQKADHVTVYPVGTRLKDIKVDEPVIGCPGDQLARANWNRTIDVVVGEGLWRQAAA